MFNSRGSLMHPDPPKAHDVLPDSSVSPEGAAVAARVLNTTASQASGSGTQRSSRWQRQGVEEHPSGTASASSGIRSGGTEGIMLSPPRRDVSGDTPTSSETRGRHFTRHSTSSSAGTRGTALLPQLRDTSASMGRAWGGVYGGVSITGSVASHPTASRVRSQPLGAGLQARSISASSPVPEISTGSLSSGSPLARDGLLLGSPWQEAGEPQPVCCGLLLLTPTAAHCSSGGLRRCLGCCRLHGACVAGCLSCYGWYLGLGQLSRALLVNWRLQGVFAVMFLLTPLVSLPLLIGVVSHLVDPTPGPLQSDAFTLYTSIVLQVVVLAMAGLLGCRRGMAVAVCSACAWRHQRDAQGGAWRARRAACVACGKRCCPRVCGLKRLAAFCCDWPRRRGDGVGARKVRASKAQLRPAMTVTLPPAPARPARVLQQQRSSVHSTPATLLDDTPAA